MSRSFERRAGWYHALVRRTVQAAALILLLTLALLGGFGFPVLWKTTAIPWWLTLSAFLVLFLVFFLAGGRLNRVFSAAQLLISGFGLLALAPFVFLRRSGGKFGWLWLLLGIPASIGFWKSGAMLVQVPQVQQLAIDAAEFVHEELVGPESGNRARLLVKRYRSLSPTFQKVMPGLAATITGLGTLYPDPADEKLAALDLAARVRSVQGELRSAPEAGNLLSRQLPRLFLVKLEVRDLMRGQHFEGIPLLLKRLQALEAEIQREDLSPAVRHLDEMRRNLEVVLKLTCARNYEDCVASADEVTVVPDRGELIRAARASLNTLAKSDLPKVRARALNNLVTYEVNALREALLVATKGTPEAQKSDLSNRLKTLARRKVSLERDIIPRVPAAYCLMTLAEVEVHMGHLQAKLLELDEAARSQVPEEGPDSPPKGLREVREHLRKGLMLIESALVLGGEEESRRGKRGNAALCGLIAHKHYFENPSAELHGLLAEMRGKAEVLIKTWAVEFVAEDCTPDLANQT